jgi:hypothetical protein
LQRVSLIHLFLGSRVYLVGYNCRLNKAPVQPHASM